MFTNKKYIVVCSTTYVSAIKIDYSVNANYNISVTVIVLMLITLFDAFLHLDISAQKLVTTDLSKITVLFKVACDGFLPLIFFNIMKFTDFFLRNHAH